MSGRQTHRLRVDIIRCDGHGHCAELLPELITLDDWGYPVVNGGLSADVPPELVRLAKRAEAVCPVLALSLRKVDANADDRASARR